MPIPARGLRRLLTPFFLMVLVGGVVAAIPSELPAVDDTPSEIYTTPSGSTAVVEMTNTLVFEPDTLRISVGTKVAFKNTSLLVHTVTADLEKATMKESAQLPEGAEPFDSGLLMPDSTFEHEFTVPGTYGYFCIPHEGAKMRGVVVVESTD